MLNVISYKTWWYSWSLPN